MVGDHQKRAWIVGVGLIGGSIGKALRSRGWMVSGTDTETSALKEAQELGAIDALGPDPTCQVCFVCVPSSRVAEVVNEVLQVATSAVVSDVSGVKQAICESVGHERFIGGHPMAGSEKVGIQGADPNMFDGRTWVLTPVETTSPDCYARLHSIVLSLGAKVLSMSPSRHDQLVATVSHLPHLLSGALMNQAGEQAEEFAEILMLAAGGFRDMTRISSSDPGIWPDICVENKSAIIDQIDQFVARLSSVKGAIVKGDRGAIFNELARARAKRDLLPTKASSPASTAHLLVQLQDRPGALAEITSLFAQMGVNIEDISIVHAPGGGAGELNLELDARGAQSISQALVDRNFVVSSQLPDCEN